MFDDSIFLAYAKHQTECDEVVRMILNGGTSFQLDDDFDESDLKYIQNELAKHGIKANLSLK